MFNNLFKEFKSLVRSFSKLHLVVRLLLAVFVLYVIYKYFYEKRILGFSFLNTLGITEGLSGQPKSLVYYRMEGCPHCKEFDDSWEEFKQKNTTNIQPRKVDSNDPETRSNGVKGFPTILLCDANKKKIKECPTRNPDEMLEFCKQNE